VKQEKLKDPTKRAKYNFLNREIKRKTKGCRDKWNQYLCVKVYKSHQAAKSKELYSAIKKITQKTTIRMQTVKSKDGQILTELNDVKDRWRENYEDLYNHQNSINEVFFSKIPQMPYMEEEPTIMRSEVTSAIKKLTEEKAPGFDCIAGEELKASGEAGINVIHKLCCNIWNSETFPDDWGRAIITPIYKKKTNWTVGITEVSAC
jgi:hypothetical protein